MFTYVDTQKFTPKYSIVPVLFFHKRETLSTFFKVYVYRVEKYLIYLSIRLNSVNIATSDNNVLIFHKCE